MQQLQNKAWRLGLINLYLSLLVRKPDRLKKVTKSKETGNRTKLPSLSPSTLLPLGKIDKDGRIADITAAYQASSDFESNNQDAISKTGSTFASSAEVKAIEEKVKDFSTSSQVLMDILDDVRKVHPVIGEIEWILAIN